MHLLSASDTTGFSMEAALQSYDRYLRYAEYEGEFGGPRQGYYDEAMEWALL